MLFEAVVGWIKRIEQDAANDNKNTVCIPQWHFRTSLDRAWIRVDTLGAMTATLTLLQRLSQQWK